MLLKDVIFKTVLDAYEVSRSMQRTDGAVIHPEEGYCINAQSIGFYFAFLYSFDHPDNPYKGDPEMVRRALLSWNQYATMINAEGKAHYISKDQDYGYWPEEWGFYYWFNTYDLLKDALAEADRRAWLEVTERIHRMFVAYIEEKESSRQYADELAVHQVNNHYLWVALAMYRYGQLFGDPESIERGARVMRRILAAQHPVGAWLENKSFVLNYADVTMGAVSLYELYSGDEKAALATRRSFNFIRGFKNPDFTKTLGIDERNHYSKKISSLTAASYALLEGGPAYLSRWIQKITADRNLHLRIWDVCMVCEMLRALPPDTPYMSDPPPPLPLNTYYPEMLTAVREIGPWILSFCGLCHTSFDSHWSLERQGLLGIYVKGVGPLCGGAHSIADPAFSLFNVISYGKVHYTHDSCRLNESSVSLQYGGHNCTVEALRVDESQAVFRFQAEGITDTEKVVVNMPLHELVGADLEINGKKVDIGENYLWMPIPPNAPVRVGDTEISFSEEAVFRYPFFPHNSYLMKQRKNFSHVFGILSVELDYLRPAVTMTLSR